MPPSLSVINETFHPNEISRPVQSTALPIPPWLNKAPETLTAYMSRQLQCSAGKQIKCLIDDRELCHLSTARTSASYGVIHANYSPISMQDAALQPAGDLSALNGLFSRSFSFTVASKNWQFLVATWNERILRANHSRTAHANN